MHICVYYFKKWSHYIKDMFVVLFFFPSISSQDYFSCHLLLLFSLLVVSESLRHHGLQHTRLPCLSFTIYRNLLKPMSVESVMLFNHLALCHPLLHLPSIFPKSGSFQHQVAIYFSCHYKYYYNILFNAT